MVEIKEIPFYISVLTPSTLKVIGAHDLSTVPGVYYSGHPYNLEGITLDFTKLGDFNYKYQKKDLIWEEVYYDEEEYEAYWTDINLPIKTFHGPEITFPFTFPFFNYEHDKCRFDFFGSLRFENKNGQEIPAIYGDYTLENVKRFPPMIMAFGFEITLEEGNVYVKSDQNSITITYISKHIDETPNSKLEIQYKLWSNGNIRVSIKNISTPNTLRNKIGIVAGYQEEAIEVDFYGINEYQTNNSYCTGQVQFFEVPYINLENLAHFIYQKFPNPIYDAVFVIPDFNLKTTLLGAAMAQILYNKIKGTGYEDSDLSTENFDASHLRCIIIVDSLDSLHIDPELPYHDKYTTFHNFAAHEFGHKWLQHLPMHSDGKSHWDNDINTVTPLATTETPYCSTLLGYASITSNDPIQESFKSFIVTSDKFPYGYCSMGLYMMGLTPKEETLPISSKSGYVYTVEDIIELLGEERDPPYEFSKKIFNAMVVFVTKYNPEDIVQDQEKIQLIIDYIKNFASYFHTVTLGRAILLFSDLLSWDPEYFVYNRDYSDIIKRDPKERISFLLNYLVSIHNAKNPKEIYQFLVNDLRLSHCKTQDCEEDPQKWPIERWLDELNKISIKFLKTFDKKINSYLPKKQLKAVIKRYRANKRHS